jgi:hypothetical protein
MLAPPLTTNYRIVGAAFDYLLRFHVERLNPSADAKGWVAANGLLFLRGERPNVFQVAHDYFTHARHHYQQYIQDGIVTDDLLADTLRLAHLDIAFRAGSDKFDEAKFRSPDDRDVSDLRALLGAVREEDFTAQKACHLNPTFGTASSLVGGGDADLLIDNKLIDIKTTKNLVLQREHFHQLIGYYVLTALGGVDLKAGENVNYMNEICEVNRLCIYYSRHAFLYSMSLSELIDPAALPSFIEWFLKSASNAARFRSVSKQFHTVLPSSPLPTAA